MCIIQRAGVRRDARPHPNSIAPKFNAAPPVLLTSRSGFTLVEIMIVVVIIGILATLGLPAFKKARERTQNTRLANDLRQFSGAFETYNLEHGAWPDDVNEGVMPDVMTGYLVRSQFEERTVYGGNYDWEGPGAFAFSAGVSLRGTFLDDPQAADIDTILDDGNLSTGRFRSTGDSYVLILEE